jgi:hypothetical protein
MTATSPARCPPPLCPAWRASRLNLAANARARLGASPASRSSTSATSTVTPAGSRAPASSLLVEPVFVRWRRCPRPGAAHLFAGAGAHAPGAGWCLLGTGFLCSSIYSVDTVNDVVPEAWSKSVPASHNHMETLHMH